MDDFEEEKQFGRNTFKKAFNGNLCKNFKIFLYILLFHNILSICFVFGENELAFFNGGRGRQCKFCF